MNYDEADALNRSIRTAWRQVAEQTMAGLSPTQEGQARELLPTLAAALIAAVDLNNLPRYAPSPRTR